MIINILLITFCYITCTESYCHSNSGFNFNSDFNFNSGFNFNSNYFNSNYLNSNYFNSNYFNSNYLNSNYFNSGFNSKLNFNSKINSNKYIISKNSQNYYSNILTQILSSLLYKSTYNSNNYLTVIQSIPSTYNSNNYLTVIQSIPSTYKSTYSYNSNSNNYLTVIQSIPSLYISKHSYNYNSNNYLTVIQSIPSLYISKHSYNSNCNLILYPTIYPTLQPTMNPTIYPTFKPTTFNPTLQPTKDSKKIPTLQPTLELTLQPSKEPTLEPTKQETVVLSFSINLELLNMSSINLDDSVKNSILLANANSMNISILYQRWKNVSILHNLNRRRLLYNLYVETETILPLDGKYKNIDPLILYNKLITDFSNNINSGNYITLLYNALSYYNSTQINIVIGSFIISQPIITYPNKTIDNNESKDKPFNYLLVLIPLVVVSSITILYFLIKYYKQNIINFLDIKLSAREDHITLSNLFESNRSLLLYKSDSVSDFNSDSELDDDSFSDLNLDIFEANNRLPSGIREAFPFKRLKDAKHLCPEQSIELSDISCNLALTSLRELYNESFSDCKCHVLQASNPVILSDSSFLQENDIILEITDIDK